MIGSFTVRNQRTPGLLYETRTMGHTAGRSPNSRPVAVRQLLSILHYFQVRQGLPVGRNDLHPRLFGS
jgi:hypothetical protein